MKFVIKDLESSGFTKRSFTCGACGVYKAGSIYKIHIERDGKRIHGYGDGTFEKGTKLKLIRAVKALLEEHSFKFATLWKCTCGGYHVYFYNPIYSAIATLVT